MALSGKTKKVLYACAALLATHTAAFFAGTKQNPSFAQLPPVAQRAIIEKQQDVTQQLADVQKRLAAGDYLNAVKEFVAIQDELKSLEVASPKYREMEEKFKFFNLAMQDFVNYLNQKDEFNSAVQKYVNALKESRTVLDHYSPPYLNRAGSDIANRCTAWHHNLRQHANQLFEQTHDRELGRILYAVGAQISRDLVEDVKRAESLIAPHIGKVKDPQDLKNAIDYNVSGLNAQAQDLSNAPF